ncbi:hypothetical protein [Umezawaea sp. NPDC059074]|uniref:hypothetical protein n=1 Tax=Umezawaea sp. NPDC059074 TaxID=3346716 RepID=UPI00368560F0
MATGRPALRELLDLTGWDGSVDVGAAWDPIEAAAGVALPGDLKELMTRFPTGYFGYFFAVYSPVPRPNGRSPFRCEMDETLELMRDQDTLPHPVHPEPGGLLPWGSTTSAHTLCWHVSDPDPSRWPVVFFDSDFGRSGTYPGTATAFLRDVLSGRFSHEFFDDHVRGRRPRFDPI